MNDCKIYVEGGETKPQQTALRRAFHELFTNAGFGTRLPRAVPCGSRQSAYEDFQTALRKGGIGFVALLVDSEDRVDDIEQPWDHLHKRDGDRWEKPDAAMDDNVFLMTTCMETWLVADRENLKYVFKQRFQESALPPLVDLEARSRHILAEKLTHASRNCSKSYSKGELSFDILGKADPAVLEQHLPSFRRMLRILRQQLT